MIGSKPQENKKSPLKSVIELVVTVGSYRRLLTVPAGLARHRVTGARVEGGELQVRFVEESERSEGSR